LSFEEGYSKPSSKSFNHRGRSSLRARENQTALDAGFFELGGGKASTAHFTGEGKKVFANLFAAV